MKTKLLIFIFFFISLLCQAQINMNQQMHQRMHMQALQQHQRFMNNMMWQMSMNKPVKKMSEKYRFGVVTLEGDSVISKKKARISFFSPIDSIVLVYEKKQKQVFYPKDTKNIFIKQGKEIVVGIRHDNDKNWIFKTNSVGDVSFYAIFPEPGLEYITHYQLGDGEVVSLTAETLKPLVADYPKAVKYLERKKKNLYKALRVYIKEEKKRKQ